MTHVERFLKGLRRVEQGVAFVAFMVMALALIGDILAREITGTGLFGATQVAVFGMIIVSFIGIGLATADGTHLRPRFADTVLPRHWQPVIGRIGDGLTAAFYAFVAVVAVSVVEESRALGDVTSTLRVVIWPFQTVIVVAFALSALRHVLYALFPALRPQEAGAEGFEGIEERLGAKAPERPEETASQDKAASQDKEA